MKQILTTLALIFAINAIAQEPISKTVGEFSTLKVYDLINVEMVQSDDNKIEISGHNMLDVVVVNKNGTLKIRMNTEEIFDGNKTHVKLFYTGVDTIDANEGAYITSTEVIDQYDLDLRAQEGGSIKVNLKTKEIEVRASTGGIIETLGSTNNVNIKVNTGGIYKGKELESITSKVALRAGGEVEVNSKELVDINIRVGGDVYVYGNPTTINENRALGGRIKRMN
jgi:hypothetical protein